MVLKLRGMAGLKEYKRENRESGIKMNFAGTVKLDGPEGYPRKGPSQKPF